MEKAVREIFIADIKSCNQNGKSPGHYFSVAGNYCDMFDGIHPVKVVGGPVYADKFSNLFVLKYDDKLYGNKVLRKVKTILNCFQVFKNIKGHYLVIQSNALLCFYIALALWSKPMNVFMIQYNNESINSGLKRLLYRLCKNRICGVFCCNEEVGAAYGLPFCVVPDYCVTNKVYGSLQQTVSNKKYDVCMLGLITEDKGVVQVASKLAGSDARVIIAGKADNSEIEQRLKEIVQSCNNITLKLSYISDEEYDTYFRQSRFCWLNYSDAYSAHSSGVVFDAIYRGTPVIGRNCKTLEFIKENELGRVYHDLNSFDFETALASDECRYLDNIKEFLHKELERPKEIVAFLEKYRKI